MQPFFHGKAPGGMNGSPFVQSTECFWLYEYINDGQGLVVTFCMYSLHYNVSLFIVFLCVDYVLVTQDSSIGDSLFVHLLVLSLTVIVRVPKLVEIGPAARPMSIHS